MIFKKPKTIPMKMLSKIFLITGMIFTLLSGAYSNWVKSKAEIDTFPHQNLQTQQRKQAKSDSLPEGVTKDWLNDLRDENGDKIIPEEPETDAMLPKVFNAPSPTSYFGASVSDAGDVNGDGYSDLIVGASNYSSATGRAYIFYGGINMNTVADVTFTGEAINNSFGFPVSKAGDVNGDGYSDVIVGASDYSSNTGRVYIYFGGTLMNNVADVIMTGEAAINYFGASVAEAGDVNGDSYSDVIVGAYGFSTNTGKAYIYFGGSAMNNVADVTITGEGINNYYGYSVSNAGDVNGDSFSDVVVGATDISSGTGKAYIYFGSSIMNNVADVTMTGEATNNYFGISVSNAGDVNGDSFSDIIVGANGYSSNTGRAYIFYGGSSMNNVADVTMTGEAINNYFGRTVSTAGDINGDGYSDIVAGAWGYSTSTGRAYIYLGGSSMNNTADVTLTGEATNNYFGYALSACGDVNGDGYSEVIVGAYGYSSNTGIAYFYDYFPNGEITFDINMNGEAAGSSFGISVSSSGDVNGDGYSDVIVGAYGYLSNRGRAYIYYGGLSMNNIADVTMTGEAPGNYFGYSVSSAGDVNGDGYSDVIIGAYQINTNRGRAYIYFGGLSMNNTADVTLNGEASNNYFGYSVSSAGDVNGDGYSDAVVGAWGYSSDVGRAYIYYGGSSVNNIADVTMTSEITNNYFGLSVSTAGDVNGDGYSDVIVGASGNSVTLGRAYIYLGGSSMNNIKDVTLTGETTGNYFGYSVSAAGDVNGDSYDDVIIGAWGYSANTGRAYIYFGSLTMNNIADVTITGESTNNTFGRCVSEAGDLNDDGYSDVIVGASGYSANSGKVYIYYGSLTMNNVADVTMAGEATNNFFGYSAAAAGDVNGDGYPDVIVGAYGNATSTGRSYIYKSPSISANIKINLVMFIQGFYNTVSNSQVNDTITALLRNTNSPYNIVDQSKAIVSSNGIAFLRFANAQNGTYYLALKHRNSIETWSSNGILLRRELTTANYDFSISSLQAYGNNQKQVDTSPTRFAIFSGDVNQDGTIDATDVSAIDNDAAVFASGYVISDLTGDNFVDGSDFAIADNNAANFVSVIRP
jgi:phage-related baseplate assembly protein